MSKRGQMPEPKRPGQFKTIRQIRGFNRAAGSLWFGVGAMRFFGTRIHKGVYGGRWFVTSEQDPQEIVWDGARRYTVRKVQEDGSIATCGDFGQYATSREAHRAALRHAVDDRLGQEVG